MLILDPSVARLAHAWLAVACPTCNAEIGRSCEAGTLGAGPHPRRIEYARLLGFRESLWDEPPASRPKPRAQARLDL